MKQISVLLLLVTTLLSGKSIVQFNIDGFYKTRPEGYYYYNPEKVGAQAFYNPLQQVIEGGFGALYNMKIDTFNWEDGFDKLHHALTNPIDVIDDYGWKKFFLYEFIPHTGKGQNYLANYFWHFIALGMRTKLLQEYYTYHQYRYPTAMAWATAYTLHYFNEVVQAAKFKAKRGSIDALPDMLFFDWVGALFFSFDPVNRFMTKYLHLTEWSHQTQLNPITNRLINNGQLYWVRINIFGTPLSIGALTGEQTSTFNLVWNINAHHQIALGAGGKVKAFTAEDNGDTGTSGMVIDFGLYYAINDNPVATLTFEPEDEDAQKENPDYYNEYTQKIILNIYPGLIDIDGFKPGLTFSLQKDAFFVGISSGSWPVGFIFSTPQGQKYLDAK